MRQQDNETNASALWKPACNDPSKDLRGGTTRSDFHRHIGSKNYDFGTALLSFPWCGHLVAQLNNWRCMERPWWEAVSTLGPLRDTYITNTVWGSIGAFCSYWFDYYGGVNGWTWYSYGSLRNLRIKKNLSGLNGSGRLTSRLPERMTSTLYIKRHDGKFGSNFSEFQRLDMPSKVWSRRFAAESPCFRRELRSNIWRQQFHNWCSPSI